MKRIISLLITVSAFGQPSTPTGLPDTFSLPTGFTPKPPGVSDSSGAYSDTYAPLNNEPFFPGGPKALEAYLDQAAVYPYQARMLNLEGTVRVAFRVQANGCLTDVRVVGSQGALLDPAAVQAVVSMPRWYPAHREGVAVSHLIELSIKFHLD